MSWWCLHMNNLWTAVSTLKKPPQLFFYIRQGRRYVYENNKCGRHLASYWHWFYKVMGGWQFLLSLHTLAYIRESHIYVMLSTVFRRFYKPKHLFMEYSDADSMAHAHFVIMLRTASFAVLSLGPMSVQGRLQLRVQVSHVHGRVRLLTANMS